MNLISLGQKLTPKRIAMGLILAQMIFRPLITSTNKKLPEATRRYAATREFFTSVFSLIGTFTFVSLAEKLIPAAYAKSIAIPLEKDCFENIQKLPLNELLKKSTDLAKLKSVFILTSFVASAISMSIITPILNNIFLNTCLDKIMKKENNNSANNKDISINTWKNNVKARISSDINFQKLNINNNQLSLKTNFTAIKPYII